MQIVAEYILYFFVYAFAGWLVEGAYWLVMEKRFRNSGIVGGPLCPIYGFGGVAITVFLGQLKPYPVLIFLLGVLLASLIEYIGHWFLQKTFKLTLWDYSNKFANLNGRICLENSLAFGVLAIMVIYLTQPALSRIIGALPVWLVWTLATLLTLYFFSELIPTLISAKKAAKALRRYGESLNDFKDQVEDRLDTLLGDQAKNFKIRFKRFVLRFHRYNLRRLSRISVKPSKK